jgi:hypothetical protein
LLDRLGDSGTRLVTRKGARRRLDQFRRLSVAKREGAGRPISSI